MTKTIWGRKRLEDLYYLTSRHYKAIVIKRVWYWLGGGSGGLVTNSCPTLVTPWTIACQALLSTRFGRQEHWNGLLFPSPGKIPGQGSQVASLPLSHQESPLYWLTDRHTLLKTEIEPHMYVQLIFNKIIHLKKNHLFNTWC